MQKSLNRIKLATEHWYPFQMTYCQLGYTPDLIPYAIVKNVKYHQHLIIKQDKLSNVVPFLRLGRLTPEDRLRLFGKVKLHSGHYHLTKIKRLRIMNRFCHEQVPVNDRLAVIGYIGLRYYPQDRLKKPMSVKAYLKWRKQAEPERQLRRMRYRRNLKRNRKLALDSYYRHHKKRVAESRRYYHHHRQKIQAYKHQWYYHSR